MEPKYLFFYTAKAAIFQFYAFVVLLLALFYVKLAFDISQHTLIVGTILYIGIVVFYSFHIDRKGRGNRGG